MTPAWRRVIFVHNLLCLLRKFDNSIIDWRYKLLWYLAIRNSVNLKCKVAFVGLFSVREASGEVSRNGGREDVRICNFTSNFVIRIFGLKDTSPAPWRLARILPSVKLFLNASQKAMKSPLYWYAKSRPNRSFLICMPYALIKGAEHATSSGWRMWKGCARHANCDNIVVIAVLFERIRMVAFIAIQHLREGDQHLVSGLSYICWNAEANSQQSRSSFSQLGLQISSYSWVEDCFRTETKDVICPLQ